MIKKKLNVAHYNFNFFSSRKLPSLYTGVIDSTSNNSVVFTEFEKNKVSEKNNLYRIYKIPPYFKLIIDNPKIHRKIELPEIDKGLLIKLSKFSTIDDYVDKQFSSRKRKQIRSSIRRLETCFNITYKIYYGDIDKLNYDFLLNKAREFITLRFSQIGKKHYHLSNWNSIEDKIYNLILQKKASLFVIYDDNKPINICINYHFNSITANAFTSYDTDYDKFSLGTIDLYKQIEWNITNNFKIFDMMMGESEYKFKWSNSHYDLNHHIIVKKNSIFSNSVGALLFIYLKLKCRIYRLAYANPKNKMLNLFLPPKGNKSIEQYNRQLFTIETVSETSFKTKEVNLINIENELYKFLRKPIYDFLHSNFETKKNVSIFKLDNEKKSYIIAGKNKCQKVNIVN